MHGQMWPVGRKFDMPDLDGKCFVKNVGPWQPSLKCTHHMLSKFLMYPEPNLHAFFLHMYSSPASEVSRDALQEWGHKREESFDLPELVT